MEQIFLLSPAHSGGKRAKLLGNPHARFDLALRLQRGDKVPIGEIFSFLSGLYFRGKFLYAEKFARPPQGLPGIYIITSNRGLMPATQALTMEEFRQFGSVEIDPAEQLYAQPLLRDAHLLASRTDHASIILLGSISTKKYVELLLQSFAPRLYFPTGFLGRGDMSRGGLLLRSVAQNQELDYCLVSGAIRRGVRPAKLPPRSPPPV